MAAGWCEEAAALPLLQRRPGRGGGAGRGRAALRGADLGRRHDRRRRGLVLAPALALDGAALPRPPRPPPRPLALGAAGARGPKALARLHRALRLLRRAQAPLLRIPPPQRQAPGQGLPRGSHRRGPRRRRLLRRQEGPIMYYSRTIFEDATPELVRDFFWDGDFRLKWDPMLAYSKTLDEFPQSEATIVHWIKKFPFFCSDREYIFGGRIWESGKTYYCVTEGVPYPSLPKKEKPRRVKLYFSSWRIRAVQSPKHVGQHSACEVTLVHYEDMGIPKDVARVAVRHGMWGAVKKLQSGFRAYQQMRGTACHTAPSWLE